LQASSPDAGCPSFFLQHPMEPDCCECLAMALFAGETQMAYFQKRRWLILVTLNLLIVTGSAFAGWNQREAGFQDYFYGVHFIDEMNGWICGENLAKTSDGGASWEFVEMACTATINDITFYGANNGLIAGWDQGVFNTSDGGLTWNEVPTDSVYYISSAQIVSETHAFAVGSRNLGPNAVGYVVKTSDNWQTVDYCVFPPDTIYATQELWDISMFNENVGLISGFARETESGWNRMIGHIWRTNDGWETVEKVYIGGFTDAINAVQMVTETKAVAAGNNGKYYISNDGASTWQSFDTDYDGRWRDLHFTDENNGWLVGDGGIILKTSDGGNTWGPQASATSTSLSKIFFLDDQKAWIAGYDSMLLHTEDAGGDINYPPDSFLLISPQLGQLVSRESATFIWEEAVDPENDPLSYFLWLRESTTGNSWYIGSDGTEITVDLTQLNLPEGVVDMHWQVSVEDTLGNYNFSSNGPRAFQIMPTSSVDNSICDMPTSYKLHNAYPNPFNPSTCLTYSIPEKAQVSLTIFDVLGRQVKVLVDSEKSAGTHSVIWNGFNDSGIIMASGTYLVQMRIVKNHRTEFIASQKLNLIK